MPFEVDARTLLFTAGACGAVLFSLFWKGQLPESVAKPIGRITFIPQLPFTFVTQTYVRNWWDELIPGSNIYIGGLPIAALGHVDQLYDLGVCRGCCSISASSILLHCFRPSGSRGGQHVRRVLRSCRGVRETPHEAAVLTNRYFLPLE
jgi:hypothetical protein